MSLDFDVFVVDPKPIPSSIPSFEATVGQATWPPSTSTLIRSGDSGLLVDCLITEAEGRSLATWVQTNFNCAAMLTSRTWACSPPPRDGSCSI
jgi:hypothetical protein